MEFGEKFFREIDLFDFTSFFWPEVFSLIFWPAVGIHYKNHDLFNSFKSNPRGSNNVDAGPGNPS